MIYLDNAATAPMIESAYEKMLPYFTKLYGNPASPYQLSSLSELAMEESREHLAQLIGANKSEIYFTSGGTESDNWALRCSAELLKHKGNHIITSKIEHSAILNTCKHLEEKGFRVSYLNVDEYGIVRMDELKKAICKETILISVMMANNEIGTIQPIAEIGRIAADNDILFHTDAVQACGHIPIDVKKANIGMLSASGHKFGGPKGIGFLYISNKIDLPPLLYGGGQENNKRSGTGNVPLAVAMGEAARVCRLNMSENIAYITKLREYAIWRILREIPYSRINGHRIKRLPGNMNFSFKYITGDELQVLLDLKDIYVSTGSACHTGKAEASHVLSAIGLSDELAHGTIRMTISRRTTKEELDTTINQLKQIIRSQRELLTGYKEMRRKREY